MLCLLQCKAKRAYLVPLCSCGLARLPIQPQSCTTHHTSSLIPETIDSLQTNKLLRLRETDLQRYTCCHVLYTKTFGWHGQAMLSRRSLRTQRPITVQRPMDLDDTQHVRNFTYDTPVKQPLHSNQICHALPSVYDEYPLAFGDSTNVRLIEILQRDLSESTAPVACRLLRRLRGIGLCKSSRSCLWTSWSC